MSGVPLPDFSPTYGGDSGPALSENGAVNVTQGGLNVPNYPAELITTPIDRDFFDFMPTAKAQDLSVYYYAAAGFVLMLLLKKKKLN